MVASLPFPDPLAFLAAFGFHPAQYPPAYWDAVDALSRAALVTDFYVRPQAKVSSLEGAHGSKLVRPPWERLVPESDSMVRHFMDYAAIPSGIQPEFGEKAPPDLVAAVRQCVSCGDGIAAWRDSQSRALSDVELTLRPFSDYISSFMVGSAAAIASHVNLEGRDEIGRAHV